MKYYLSEGIMIAIAAVAVSGLMVMTGKASCLDHGQTELNYHQMSDINTCGLRR